MKTLTKVLKAVVPSRGAGLMKALALSMFFVGLLFLNSCAAPAIIVAAAKGDTARVKTMIEEGADVNAKDKDGWTALMYVSSYPSVLSHN